MPCSGILRSLTHPLSQATCKPSTCAQHIQPSQYPLVPSLRPQLRLIATTLHIIGFVGDVLGVAGRGVLIPLGLPWRQRSFQEVIPKSSLQCFPRVNASELKHGPYIPKKASATPAQDVQPRKVLLRKLDHARPHGNAALNQNDPKAVSCKTNMTARFTKNNRWTSGLLLAMS